MTEPRGELVAMRDDYIRPLLGCGLGAANAVVDATIDGDTAQIALRLAIPAQRIAPELAADVSALVQGAMGLKARVDVVCEIQTAALASNLAPLKNVKNIIAVASGKGGVGKSTVSANLALALVAEGARVGLLDADIYGPSQPQMMGATAKPESPDGKTMHPVMAHGVQTMSIGYLVDESQAMIWRGPMVSQALTQLINETRWDDLDYLIIDLPPGTGDIQLTLSQKIPVSGAVIVTTPQDTALLDARKAPPTFN